MLKVGATVPLAARDRPNRSARQNAAATPVENPTLTNLRRRKLEFCTFAVDEFIVIGALVLAGFLESQSKLNNRHKPFILAVAAIVNPIQRVRLLLSAEEEPSSYRPISDIIDFYRSEGTI